jgi:hypothetical protein
MTIKHKIPLKIQTSSSNCVQTSTSQFVSYYGLIKSPDEIERAVPVRYDAEGKPMGTLFADIGAWLIKQCGKSVSMHVFDAQIIDRSWGGLSKNELATKLKDLKKHGVKSAKTPYASILIEAYNSFLDSGGNIIVDRCTNDLLHTLLIKGPILAIISYNYMYNYPRVSYNSVKRAYGADYIEGKVLEHAIVITGYDDNSYYYNDPDSESGGQHKVGKDILIGAICSAQINSDNYLLVIE